MQVRDRRRRDLPITLPMTVLVLLLIPIIVSMSLTRKQKAFADKLLSDVKVSGKQAITEVYGKPGGKLVEGNTAEVMASENLRNPKIMAYLHSKSDLAEDTLVELMEVSKTYAKSQKNRGQQGAQYANVAVSAAKDILDRVHGKATQRVENTTILTNITIDLSGGTAGGVPEAMLEPKV